MSRVSRLAASGLSVLLLAGAAAATGAPEQPVRESASVTIIQIPVNVIGKDGKPVTGLTAADFELFDDDKRKPIAGMEIVDLANPDAAQAGPAASTPASRAAARRRWLIIFDLSYTSLSGLLRARDGAQDFVAKAMKGTDLAAVATISVETGWKLLVNFTADRAQLAQAIDTLGLPGLTVRSSDPLGFAFAPPGMKTTTFQSSSLGKHDEEMQEAMNDFRIAQRAATDDLERGRVVQLLKVLGAMGRTLDSVRGRKHVLFFSEGFETRLLSGNAADKATGVPYSGQQTALQEATSAAASGEYWKVDSDARYGSSATRSFLTDALAELNRSDTILHTIDISGLRSESDASSSAPPGSGTDALFTLAAETNGEFVRNANQLGGEIEKLVARTDLVYVLFYQPKSLAKPYTFHSLRIRVKKPGAKVVARSGYFEPTPFAALSPMEQVLEAADAITAGPRQDSFSTAVFATPFPTGGPLSQVPVVIQIPGGPLLAGDDEPEPRVQVFAYAADASGTLTDYTTQEMSLDLAKLRAGLVASGIKFFGTLSLPPGDYTLRTLVRNADTGRFSVAATSLHVSGASGTDAVVLPPFFREPDGRWIRIQANQRADAPPTSAGFPFTIGGDFFDPSVSAPVSGEKPVQVAVMTYNFGPPAAGPAPLDVRAEILAPDGQSRPASVTVSDHSDFEGGGGRKLILDLKLEGLPPGRYTLKIEVSDPASGKKGEASGPFEVK